MVDRDTVRRRVLECAIDAIHEAAFEWSVLSGDDQYRDALNYIQGVLEMVNSLDKILDER